MAFLSGALLGFCLGVFIVCMLSANELTNGEKPNDTTRAS